MKTFLKTVSLTLAISVTMLFFSSHKKVEAAATTATLSTVAVAIGALIVAIATYFGVDGVPDIQSYVKSSDFGESVTTDSEGNAIFNPSSGLPAIVDTKIFNTFAQEAAKAYNTHISSGGGTHGGSGSHRISSEAYNTALNEAINGVIASGIIDNISSGAAAGITMGITTVNGKPQKVTTVQSELTVEVFDYLDLDYVAFSKISDVYIDYYTTDMLDMRKQYYLFFITSDNTLYYLPQYLEFSTSIYSDSGHVAFNIPNSGMSVSGSSRNGVYMGFRFYESNGILCYGMYYSYVDMGRFYRKQSIFSTPELTSYPVLFQDKISHDSVYSTTFNNYEYDVKFQNKVDNQYISSNDILSLDIQSAGYFIGSVSDDTIKTAAKMLTGTENAVQGGTNTTYSDLSDIEKAIYALAKQQGITYEEMLEQCNIMINENGEMYLESLDGVTHSIESLLSEFDKLLEQGSITNENTAASVEQLKAILEYLKGLNIEGIGSYIQQLESTLDDLKQGDKDRETILDNVLGQLQGLNDYLNSLDIESIGANIQSITDSISNFITAFKDILFDGMTAPKGSFDYTSGDIIEHYTEQFPLYEQCKKLINNLFNYDDIIEPPNFSFYWDSDGDGVKEVYNPFDFSILETKLTNENMVDKSIFSVEIKVIDLIRYILAIIIYGFFVMRLIRRLPTLYGSGPFASM